jgi:CheY-like chemotaxis protein
MKTKSHVPRVLVAEDNPQGAELLEAYFSGLNYEIRAATDGEATLKAVRDWKPDLILLDVMMPKLSGFEVCKRLRSDPATRDIAVIMVTALDQPSDIERAVDVGTNDFLTKPINKAELLLRVQAMLESHTGKGELAETLEYINAVQQGR